MSARITPDRIMQSGMGFEASKRLLSAGQLDIFSVLGAGSRTGGELIQALGLHPRANPDFFDAVVALRFS